MLRADESNVIARALDLPETKKANYFERINFGAPVKKDPFEGKVSVDVWKIQGNKLLKKKSKEVK